MIVQTVENIKVNGGDRLLNKYHGSPSKILESVFPEEWRFWNLERAPKDIWERSANMNILSQKLLNHKMELRYQFLLEYSKLNEESLLEHMRKKEEKEKEQKRKKREEKEAQKRKKVKEVPKEEEREACKEGQEGRMKCLFKAVSQAQTIQPHQRE